MSELLTRAEKGSPLTFNEMDANVNELDRRTGTGWSDLPAPVTVLTGASAPTTGTVRNGIIGLQFSPDINQECFANVHINHDYIAGTMVYPHIHWTTNTTSTGTVRFGIEYTLARRDDSVGLRAFGATQTLYIEHPVTSGEQYSHQVSEPADGFGIDGTDLQEDALILCRFFREAEHVNDTYPDPVFMLVVDLHYQCDTLATPLRFPPFN